MPTGRCNFPQHHGSPSAGPPIGLVLALLIGALIVAELHTVIVVLAVAAVLSVIATAVALLWHAGHAAPYDAWNEPEAAPALLQTRATASVGSDRTAELELQIAELRQALTAAPAQHLHLHGVAAEDLAAILAQRSGNAIEGER